MLGLLEKIIISSSSQKKANKHFFKEGRVYYYFFLFFSSVPIVFAYNKHRWTMILKINSFKNCMVVTILKNLSTSGHRRLWLILTIQSCIYAIYDDTYFYCAMIMMMSILISKVKTLWVWRYLYMYMYVPIVYYQASN